MIPDFVALLGRGEKALDSGEGFSVRAPGRSGFRV